MSHACDLCDQEFSSLFILKLHYLSHTGKTYQCEFCETSFSHEAYLIVHCRNDHQKKLYFFEPNNKSFLQNRNRKENYNQHKKGMLNKKGKNTLLVANDLDRDASVTPDAAKENEAGTVSEEEILGNLNTSQLKTGQSHAKRKYPCSTCGKTFAKKTILKIHQSTHTNKRPFVCDICGNGFKQAHHLKNHQRIHSGEKPFACDTCGKAYSTKQVLSIHHRIHTNERPFICKTCGKSFTRKHVLTDHHRVHSKEKPFACDLCGKIFAWKSNLKAHFKIHGNKKACGF